MQENEFEKQVQQKMDELKLHPSDTVWQKIEAQIRKEKRRRWMLVFLPLMFIGLLYGGYVLLNRIDSIPYKQQQLTKNLIEKNSNDSYRNEKASNRIDSIKKAQTFTKSKKSFSEPGLANGNNNKNIKTLSKPKSPRDYEFTKSFLKDRPIIKKEPDLIKKIVENEKFINTAIKTPEQKKILTEIENKSDSITITESEISTIGGVDLIKEDNDKKNKTVINAENKVRATLKNEHLWRWSVLLAPGISAHANSFFGTQAKSLSNNPSQFSGSPGPSNNTFTPSLIKLSAAIITGISAEKNISKKIIFTTGLTYKLLGTKNNVGTDSADFFRADIAVKTYKNSFHYIELPIGIKFQITNSTKTPLYLHTGFSISQLIRTNALQFNNSTGLYFHNNSEFNKTQIGLNTGLDIAFVSKQKQSLLVGPYLNYGISKIAPQGYNKHHFTFIGLRAQIIFIKK